MKLYLRLSGAVALWLLFTDLLSAQATAETALRHLQQSMMGQNWSAEEVASLKLLSHHRSSASGLTHFYFQQEVGGIPLMPAWASIHLDDKGNVFHENKQLIGQLAGKLPHPHPSISTEKALEIALNLLKAEQPVGILPKRVEGNTELLAYLTHDNQELAVPTNLVYQMGKNGNLYLCWNLVIPVKDDVWDICLNAQTGQEISRRNWVHHCHFDHNGLEKAINGPHYETHKFDVAEAIPKPAASGSMVSFAGQYNIFPMPVESPIYGDRSLTLGSNIVDATASPNGWHDIDGVAPSPDYEYTRGNNVYAYYAPLGTNSFDPTPMPITRTLGLYTGGNVPWPNNLEFDYNHSLDALFGTAFIEDAVTNLFAWNNICHDVFYRYGFDEAAGNFQEINYSNMGEEGDYVRARSQENYPLNSNNAAFFTPPEPPPPGSNPPYMRMYLWDTAMPDSILDGDFDNAIITHEYGHGVSIRLVGGPATNACLTNFEQGGEGWSDFFGLMLTMADHDNSGTIEKTILGEGIRSIGAYVLGNMANEDGVRPAHYSHNMDCTTAHCNDFTYGDVPHVAEPHGVGFVWCTMLWDMTLDLIEAHGFEPDIYNIPATKGQHKGNTRAMTLVLEGLKLTACNPTFPQMRDAILEADTAIYGAANSNLIWAAFARRGLGYSATAGGNEAFDDPTMLVTKTVDKVKVDIGEHLTYTITVQNNSQTSLTNVSISDPVPTNLNVTSVSHGGNVQNKVVMYPVIPEIPVGQSETRTFTGEVTGTSWTTIAYDNPVETTVQPDFAPLPAWLVDGGYPNPNTGSTLSWWHLDAPAVTDASLVLTLDLDATKNNHLSFWQYYDLEPGIDGGVIEILVGSDWIDLADSIKQNGYNQIILDDLNTPIGVPIQLTALSGRRAFSGFSGGYVQTIIDLSGYDGLTSIRFRIATDEANVTANCDPTVAGCDGWYLDDFIVFDLRNILNTAYATSDEGFSVNGNVGKIGSILFQGAALPIELASINATPVENDILVKWSTQTERDNAGFELQRRSATESSFEKIAWIKGQGTDYQTNDYQILDKDVQPGITYYYRLKQVDFSGSFNYSKVVAAMVLDGQQNFAVYPNPVKGDQLFLQFAKPAETPVLVELFTSHGQPIEKRTLPPDQPVYTLNIPGLASGFYLLQIQMNGKTYQRKLIIP